jgi:hypothetical protein
MIDVVDDPVKMEATLKRNREIARKEFQDEIDKITKKEIHELNAFQIAFLRARISYLKPEEKVKFKSILEPTKKVK